MIDTQNTEQNEEKEAVESAPAVENAQEALPETGEIPTENAGQENLQELREQIEKTDIDDSLKLQVQSQAQDLKALDEEKKLKKLVELATEKGVVYAVNVAKKMDDAYLVDKLHDTLAEAGLYKNFKP